MKKTGVLVIVMFILMSCSALAQFPNEEEGNTTVQVKNEAPDVEYVRLRDGETPSEELAPEAGNETTFYCYADVTDPNGNDDIKNVSAEIYGPSSYFGDNDFDDWHYTNSSCDYDSAYGDATCNFPDVEFYAEPGEWHCQINATDFGGNENSTENDSATMVELAAIDVQDDLVLDFGYVQVNDVSDPKSTEFKNVGNIGINTEVDVFNNSIWDYHGMDCDIGDISAGFFSAGVSEYDISTSMYGDSPSDTRELSTAIAEATGDDQPPTTGDVWWEAEVPYGAGGNCTGHILLGALPY
ncbi:MAG: hypothetical protein ACQEP1_01250 [Nanobdellota archaeon]